MTGFLNYIHYLRGIAILYVVIVHSRALNPEWLSHPEVNNFFDTFFDPSEGNGTVLFLFIGGFLFQHLTANKPFVYSKYLEQKFKVIILPYIIISIPLIIIRMNTDFRSLSLPEGFHDKPAMYQFVHFLLTGAHMPPFWFITTIVLFYLSAPLLKRSDNDKFYKYIFPVFLLIALFTYRPAHNANPFMAYVHYLPIYMLGMCVSFYRKQILNQSRAFLLISSAIYATLCILELSGHLTLSRDITFQNVMYDGVFAFNVYIFKGMVLCLMAMLILYELREKQIPALDVLGNYSFGIFFVHFLFISFSRKIVESFNVVINFSIPAYLAYFFFVLLSSVIVVFFVKKIAGDKSRYLIGS